jgi:hypothetical protein
VISHADALQINGSWRRHLRQALERLIVRQAFQDIRKAAVAERVGIDTEG